MFHVPSSKFQEKGFTLIEVTVAVVILVVGIVGIYTTFLRIVILTSGISNRLVAAYLAQEGIEIVRNIRDTNWVEGVVSWNEGLTTCSGGCEADYKTGTPEEETPLGSYDGGNYLNIDSNNFYSYSIGDQAKYKRKITIEEIDIDTLKVTVWVDWEEKGKPYDFEAEEYIYNYW